MQTFAESTMNELLGWYGYDKVDLRESEANEIRNYRERRQHVSVLKGEGKCRSALEFTPTGSAGRGADTESLIECTRHTLLTFHSFRYIYCFLSTFGIDARAITVSVLTHLCDCVM